MSRGHGTAAAPASRQAGAIQIPPSGLVSSEFAPATRSLAFEDTSGSPGLGFDYPHLTAIGGRPANDASPFHSRGHRRPVTFTPVLFWGFPYYSEDAGADPPDQMAQVEADQSQPEMIVNQQETSEQPVADSSAGRENLPVLTPEAEEATPIPDVSNFILVRRDGRIVFATVFSVVGTQLQYVSPEGIRRTLEMTDLDADATQQMNEARGTTVQFHN